MLVEAAKRLEILLACAPEPERTADEDRPVPPRRLELVHRLHEERRRQSLARRFLAAERDHVRRDVAAVDVEAGTKVRDQQPACPASDVERRLTASLDVPPEVGNLVRPELVVELRPPPRDQAVVPGLRSAVQPLPPRSRCSRGAAPSRACD